MKTDLRILAYNYIKDKILNNEYTSNQIISEKMISDELSISKTPVKEAFLYMESENFLIINPRKSVSVREVDLKLIKDVFQVRSRIEPLIVEPDTGPDVDQGRHPDRRPHPAGNRLLALGKVYRAHQSGAARGSDHHGLQRLLSSALPSAHGTMVALRLRLYCGACLLGFH